MNNSCIIGYGMVGQATANLFGVKKYFDTDATKSNITLEEASKCKVVFICLPTYEKDGKYQVEDIIETVRQIKEYGGTQIFVIRSTVHPGFADHLRSLLGVAVVSNPEFLTESTWEKDIKHPPFILLGTDMSDLKYAEVIKAMYEARIKSAPVIVTDSKTAELAKLALNGFFVTKVVYANEIFNLCQTIGTNYKTVKDILEKHPFGYKNHAEIFHKGGRGAGGKCLRKDMAVLAYLVPNDLLMMINGSNNHLLSEYPKNEN